MHSADFHSAVGLHLLIDLLLVVGDDVQFTLKLAHSAERTDMGLVILGGGKVKSAAGLQIFCCFF